MPQPITILGIPFFQGSVQQAVDTALKGGLVVAPAAPALAELDTDAAYRIALETADINLADSGLMALLWNLFHSEKVNRISGYLFLKELLTRDAFSTPRSSCWIMPTEKEMRFNLDWLNSEKGFPITAEDCYLAPMYPKGEIEDEVLLQHLSQNKPPIIIVNIGGGTQEKLGLYLRQQLDYNPTIICTGAAIAFMTGQQANIPMWADRLYLGWFFRCLSEPRKFIPRYWDAIRFIPMLLKHGAKSPTSLNATTSQ